MAATPRSDGTEAGTKEVSDILPGAQWSSPRDLTAVGSTLYFTAKDATTLRSIWKSDGTSEGTARVSTQFFPPDGFADPPPNPRDLTAAGGMLYFLANDGTHGRELWRSDGTAAGTMQVSDIREGPEDSTPFDLAWLDGLLYFSASDGVFGRELWSTDGTASGTKRITDINPGSGDSNPRYLKALAGKLYFAAYDPLHGEELFTLTPDADRECGDLDGDGRVNSLDLTHFRNLYNRRNRAADLDGDGRIDGRDLALLRMKIDRPRVPALRR